MLCTYILFTLNININKNDSQFNKLIYCRMNDIKALRFSKRKALGRRTESSLNDRVNNTAKK